MRSDSGNCFQTFAFRATYGLGLSFQLTARATLVYDSPWSILTSIQRHLKELMALKFSLDPEKIVNAVAYFAAQCRNATKMKICKLLYFADKQHLLRYGRPITGDTYVRKTYGPTPSAGLNMMRGQASSRLTALFQSKVAVHSNDVRPLSSPDLNVFSKSDLRVMQEVYKTYGHLTAAQLSRLSHREPSWKKTHSNQLIDFELFFEGHPEATATLDLLKEESRPRKARPAELVHT